MPDSNSSSEVWRNVVGYEGVYEVSNLGRVRRILATNGARVGRFVKPHTTIFGYPEVTLWNNNQRKNRRVHQLVAEAFLGPCPPGMEVNHRDGNRQNPTPANLEYATHAENCRHAARVLRSQAGECHHNAKLTAVAVRDIRANCARNMKSYREYAKRYGVHPTLIGYTARGNGWQHVADEVLA